MNGRWTARCVTRLTGMLLLPLLFAACSKSTAAVEFPTDLVTASRGAAIELGDSIRRSLEDIEIDMAEAFRDVPADVFPTQDLDVVRFSLLGCFVSPLCEPGDTRVVCVEHRNKRDTRADVLLGLETRAPVLGYLPCDIPYTGSLDRAAKGWSDEAFAWVRRRTELVDSLRVRLKALIPERLGELDERLANYDVELRQLYDRAEDTWREAQRVERRAEQRRREEEAWERFQVEMLALEEALATIRVDVGRLREHQRRDVQDVAVRIATLGAPEF